MIENASEFQYIMDKLKNIQDNNIMYKHLGKYKSTDLMEVPDEIKEYTLISQEECNISFKGDKE